MATTINEVVELVSEWHGKEISIEPLKWGTFVRPHNCKKYAILINFMDAEEELCHNLRFTT
ncbi:MAG: hypothetical protein JRF60_06880 [Deltaproteobacteria bacterium]|nr:hypothetical protein [Deltaproteobacteria bacterium]